MSHNDVKKLKLGRPRDAAEAEAFEKVAGYLRDNDNEKITINNLIEKMVQYSGDNAYTHLKMRKYLEEYFGEELFVTDMNGKSNVVTFKITASSILHNLHFSKTNNEDVQKKMIIETAAELIKCDIKALAASRELYPTQDDISSREKGVNFVPNSLQLMLRTIFTGKDVDMKVASIGQAMIQAARLRILICPLQIGLAVQMHHWFSSKFLINTLSSLGFCSSYNKVLTFEMNAAVSENST